MKVVLAADGSIFTTSSVELLGRLPFPEGSELSVLTVVPHAEATTGARRSEESRTFEAMVRKEAERVVQRTAEEASRLGMPISQTIWSGGATDEIIRHGTQMQADLVVVGSHGRRGLRRFLLGSVALKVVTYAPCSVLIVRPAAAADTNGDGPPKPLRVLIATDGSTQANAAITQFSGLASGGWCTIKVVTVMELITAFHMEYQQRLSESWRQRMAEATRHLQATSDALAPLAVKVETQIVEAESASEAILDAAGEFDADMIVIGGTGKGQVERVLLGSVAGRVARHARCSVWVGR